MVSFLLPNHLKYWINSIPKPSCALLNKLDDLTSNKTLLDITIYSINGKTIPYVDKCQSYDAMVRCILSYLGEQYGWNNLPPTLRHTTTCDMIARGQPEETLCLLELLYRISTNQPVESTPSSPTRLLQKKKDSRKKDKLLEIVLENTPKKSAEGSLKERSGRHIQFGNNQTKLIPSRIEAEDSPIGKGSHHNLQDPLPTVETEDISVLPSKNSDAKKGAIHAVLERPPHPSSSLHQGNYSTNQGSKFRHTKQNEAQVKDLQRSGSPPDLDLIYLTKNVNDIDLVFGDLPINQPMDNTVSSNQRMIILRWLSTLGLCPRPPAYDPCSGAAYQNEKQELDLDDDWNNGVLLSQLAAICSHGNRNEVKEVTTKPIVKMQFESKAPELMSQHYKFGHKRCFVHDGAGTKIENKPTLMLVGTENIVKSKAQAIRNMQIALKSLSNQNGLEDLELILPHDLVYGRRSLWPVLNDVYRISPTIIAQFQRGRSRSRSASVSRSISKDKKHSLSPASKSFNDGEKRGRGRSPVRTSKGELRTTLTPPRSQTSRALTPKKTKTVEKAHSTSPQKYSSPKRPEDPGKRARKSIRSASPVKSSHSQRSPETIHHPLKLHIKKSKNLKISKPTKNEKSPTELENGWNSSWSQRDRDTIWDIDPDLRLHGRVEGRPQVEPIKPRPAVHVQKKIPKQHVRQEPTWYPPTLSLQDNDMLSHELDRVPHITPQQQHVIKDWLYSLGFSIRQYEGGYVNLGKTPFLSTSTIDSQPLDLKDDRIRNGELLCDLVCILEPNASKHSQLQQLVYRKPVTITHVMSNLERALWLLRIRKCPPIPMVFLTYPKLIMEGNRDMIWGLFNEMMKGYPLPTNLQVSSNPTTTSVSLNSQLPLYRHQSHALPYTLQDRKLLDYSLVHWLLNEEILSGIMEGLLPTDLPSITTLEGPLRDGTLFCLLVNKILGNPIKGYHRASKTYATSVNNILKCLNILKLNKNMTTRFLYPGVEHDIVKGEWSAILGLLEDLHKLRDGISPNKFENEANQGIHKPYLGELEYHWPPPLESTDEHRVFTVDSTSQNQPSNSKLNLKNNAPVHQILYPPDQEKKSKIMKKKIQERSISPPPPPPPPPLPDDEDEDDIDQPDSKHDIVPGKKLNPVRDMRLDYISNKKANFQNEKDDKELKSDMRDEQRSSVEYHPPDWGTYQPKNDIMPSSFSGGVGEWKRSHNDLHPQRRDPPITLLQEINKGDDDIDEVSDIAIKGSVSGSSLSDSRGSRTSHSLKNQQSQENPALQFSYRGPPKSCLLRVQAMNSRISHDIPRDTHQFSYSELEDDSLDDEDVNKYTSPIKALRESYEKENIRNLQSHRIMQQENENEENSWNHLAKEFYRGNSTSDQSPPSWFKNLQSNSQQNQHHTKIKNDQYDENYSVNSTPPQQKPSASSGISSFSKHRHLIATTDLIDSNRYKSAIKIFRWLSKLGLISPSIPPLEVHTDRIPSSSSSGVRTSRKDQDHEFYLPTFTDGVLLGKLIQKLERIGPLNGFTEYPKSRAQKLQNIRKVLQHLSQKNKIPLRSLAIDEEILEGNSTIIIDLLMMIKEVYKGKYVQ